MTPDALREEIEREMRQVSSMPTSHSQYVTLQLADAVSVALRLVLRELETWGHVVRCHCGTVLTSKNDDPRCAKPSRMTP